VLFLLGANTQAQNQPLINSRLNGKVIDAKTKEPLAGVLVQIEGVTNQTQTNGNGEFSLVTGQSFPYNIIVSYIGYEKTKVHVDGSPVTVALKELINELNSVVVIGYGTQRKSDLVGAVAKVDPTNTKTIPEASFDTQLQGNVAGVQINGGTGIPGSNTFIRVRGSTSINSSNDPLYVVDGIFVNNSSLQSSSADRTTSPLADLNPNDIETIEVLKDAAAISIYGS